MLFQDSNADIRLCNSDGTSFENWWIQGTEVLLNTDWYLDNVSNRFFDLCSPRLKNRIRHLTSLQTLFRS